MIFEINVEMACHIPENSKESAKEKVKKNNNNKKQ